MLKILISVFNMFFTKKNGLYTLFLIVQLSFSQLVAQDSVEIMGFEPFSKTNAIKYLKPQKAITILNKATAQHLKEGDTIKGISKMLSLADVYGHSADYANSYDVFWKSLLMADQLQNDSLNCHILMRLGRFYSFYKREEKALEYLQRSLNLKKQLIERGKIDSAYLVENHYAFSSTYREFDQYDLALKHMDSCKMFYKKVPGQIAMEQLDAEKAFIFSKSKRNGEAIDLFKKVEPWFVTNRPSYLVLFYTYWGDVYMNLSDLNASETFYKKAIANSEKYNGHIDFTPLIYERLSELYLKQGKLKLAFDNQKKAKDLDALFFDSRSLNNRSLLEIKDDFRLEKDRQEKLIQKQRLEKLQQEEKIILLQRTLLIGTIFFIILTGYFYFKYLQNKHRVEKALIRRNKELEIQKARELIELKNKELAASALQLVEKDEFMKDLKSKLRKGGENMKVSDINKILRTASVINTNTWEEFKLRFTSINEEFYDRLTNKFPNLTQGDHKVCALIKLNFSSKDMSRLLGISVESVHTTRHRLRKKLHLTRSDNLEEFIANL